MSLRDEMQAIYNQHGRLTPALVVETARPKNHPLHSKVFDRPKGEAAEAWYKHRAHELIQSVKIVYREATEEQSEKKVRAFHAVRSESGVEYRPAEEIAEDPFARQLVLRDMEREWKQLLARYEHFEEFLEMVKGDVRSLVAA